MRRQSLTASATFVASIFAATAIGLAATPASAREKAQTEQLASADQVTTAATTQAAKICRRIPSSSSRKTERVCLTKEDWKKVEEEAR